MYSDFSSTVRTAELPLISSSFCLLTSHFPFLLLLLLFCLLRKSEAEELLSLSAFSALLFALHAHYQTATFFVRFLLLTCFLYIDTGGTGSEAATGKSLQEGSNTKIRVER